MNIPFCKSRSVRQQAGRLQLSCLIAAFFLIFQGTARGDQGVWPLADWPEPQPTVEEVRPPVAGSSEELIGAVDDIANQLADNLQGLEPGQELLEDGLVVCSFVELKKLARTSSFGRYLADGLINSFQQRQYRVVEVRKTTDILVQAGRGEYGLSRDPALISERAAAGATLTGTYTVADDRVLVNARIVDNRDGTVLSSASVNLSISPLIRQLLADKATARSSADREFVYVKKLEP